MVGVNMKDKKIMHNLIVKQVVDIKCQQLPSYNTSLIHIFIMNIIIYFIFAN